ncbi:TIGR03364 family FAD-dependent oxidoreductase [Leucobacter luti]|uniref:FAD dependent oxidoreductase TIGR03364 n=1 Tax=Leucobacter luti TaxID=340320 RepID=A0A4Q7TQ71_9MICO|nr:TIGR03364 family FAD-dependent oxidoreductase [Leucobacter luti]MBL3699768.1 TIGR03364 family FAD-dependent oxidoreductase [Leucobacter luti]RZT62911.1 FAD dependent oxidoreductase TIGR03364 [Leucobacter luti]
MNSQTPAPSIAIVGAGIVGLAHAVAALDAGYRVTVIEQDAAAVTSSVRNFGHVGASVQAGELGELARESLPLWLGLAERAGVEARRSGTLAVARSDAEAAVLHEVLAERAPEGARLLSGAAAAAELRLAPGGEAAGAIRAGLMLPADITANPRTAVARIAAWIAGHEQGEVRFRTTVHAVDTGLVETSRGRIEADTVIVATGHLLGRLFPELASTGGVRECALQMARVRAPHAMGLGPAVLTGTSMLRYGRFDGPAADALRDELTAQRPELFEISANVMLTQQADGTLLVGDSHAAHDAAPPFLDERWSRILLDEVATLLGAPRLDVLERWQGLYATSTAGDILRASPAPGVHVVTLTTGVGMTVGLGLGARTIAAL